MPQNGDELFAEIGKRLTVDHLGLGNIDPIFGVEMVGNQFSEKREGTDDLRIVDLMRIGIYGAKCSEEPTIGQNDGH